MQSRQFPHHVCGPLERWFLADVFDPLSGKIDHQILFSVSRPASPTFPISTLGGEPPSRSQTFQVVDTHEVVPGFGQEREPWFSELAQSILPQSPSFWVELYSIMYDECRQEKKNKKQKRRQAGRVWLEETTIEVHFDVYSTTSEKQNGQKN
jgi:hypothetical protein